MCASGLGGCLPHPLWTDTPRQTPLHRHPPSGPLHAGIHTSPAQCMLGYTPPPHVVHPGIRSTRGRYASQWNAFLFNIVFFSSSLFGSLSQRRDIDIIVVIITNIAFALTVNKLCVCLFCLSFRTYFNSICLNGFKINGRLYNISDVSLTGLHHNRKILGNFINYFI